MVRRRRRKFVPARRRNQQAGRPRSPALRSRAERKATANPQHRVMGRNRLTHKAKARVKARVKVRGKGKLKGRAKVADRAQAVAPGRPVRPSRMPIPRDSPAGGRRSRAIRRGSAEASAAEAKAYGFIDEVLPNVKAAREVLGV